MSAGLPLPDWPLLSLPPDAVEVGRWAGAWGLRGEFKIQPFSADAVALRHCRTWWVQPVHAHAAPGQAWQLQLRRAPRWHGSLLVGGSDALTQRETAQALQGARVLLPRQAFPQAASDEFYWVDLIGLQVINREGLSLGVVRDLLATGAQTVLVLQDASADPIRQRMIPFVAAYIDAVDLAARTIRVDWSPEYD